MLKTTVESSKLPDSQLFGRLTSLVADCHSFDMVNQKCQSEEMPASQIIARSSLYQAFLSERREILKHKWLESEKAGGDIGFERALLSWVQSHRKKWRASQRS